MRRTVREALSCSAVVVTRNRPVQLRNLLRSIERFGRAAFDQVIVVDDSRASLPLEREFPGLPISHRHHDERLFISRAKNLGASEARSEYVFFIDDDNFLTSSSLNALDELARAPKAGAVMPSVLYQRDPSLVWVYATPFLPGRWEFDLIGRNRPRDASFENRLTHTDALPNGSAVRRDALRACGGFDESLPVNSSAEACRRLAEAGWTTHAYTGAFLLHDVGTPAEPGSWAEHGATDPDRVYYEARDWFVFRRRLHHKEAAVRWRALVHSLRFAVPLAMGFAIRPERGRWAAMRNLTLGVCSGVRGSVS